MTTSHHKKMKKQSTYLPSDVREILPTARTSSRESVLHPLSIDVPCRIGPNFHYHRSRTSYSAWRSLRPRGLNQKLSFTPRLQYPSKVREQ
jgi:hypothetical protein